MIGKIIWKYRKNILLHTTVSIITAFVLLFVIGILLWFGRGNISAYIVNTYVENMVTETQKSQEKKADKENPQELNNTFPEIIQNVYTQESHIVNLVEKVNPAVVSIIANKEVPIVERYYTNPFGDLWGGSIQVPQYREKGTEQRQVGAGSGFIVSSDGLVITNRHVVSDMEASYVLFTNEGERYDLDVVDRDTYLDIAVLKIISEKEFPFLSFGDSDNLRLGQTVVAIGNALGEFRNSVSVGVVSGLSRSITAGDRSGNTELLEKVIQTDAAINPGNSGGPLLDINGKVVGVNVAVAQSSENIGFALPGNSVKQVVASVKENGEIIRPFLGVRYLAVDSQLQKEHNIPVDYGVILVSGNGNPSVVPGSAADKAGLKENDIILEIDGQRIDETNTLSSTIQEKKVGQTISIRIMREGSISVLKATLQRTK